MLRGLDTRREMLARASGEAIAADQLDLDVEADELVHSRTYRILSGSRPLAVVTSASRSPSSTRSTIPPLPPPSPPPPLLPPPFLPPPSPPSPPLPARRRMSLTAWRALVAGVGLMISGVLPAFLTASLASRIPDDFAFGNSGVGLAIAIFHVMCAVCSTPAGRLVERIGPARGMRLAATRPPSRAWPSPRSRSRR